MVSNLEILIPDLGRKISERTGEPLEVVFIPADQCLDSEVQFSPLSRDFSGRGRCRHVTIPACF